MGFINDEGKEKRPSLFLKYEQENKLVLKSNLYKINFHYLPDKRKSVSCKGEDCYFCKSGVGQNTEYNYYINLNGQNGVINVKPSVFFSLQSIAKASKKETRQISWLVIKEGSGLDTEYTVSKDENLSKEECEKIQSEIEKFNKELEKAMKSHEEILEKNYTLFCQSEDINPNDVPL